MEREREREGGRERERGEREEAIRDSKTMFILFVMTGENVLKTTLQNICFVKQKTLVWLGFVYHTIYFGTNSIKDLGCRWFLRALS